MSNRFKRRLKQGEEQEKVKLPIPIVFAPDTTFLLETNPAKWNNAIIITDLNLYRNVYDKIKNQIADGRQGIVTPGTGRVSDDDETKETGIIREV